MVDYDKFHAMRIAELERTGGSAKDGLTVRDYFAAKAMQALIEKYDETQMETAIEAYEWADAMMKQRLASEPERCSVEEAFGLPQ